jgi:hypothetical protein
VCWRQAALGVDTVALLCAAFPCFHTAFDPSLALCQGVLWAGAVPTLGLVFDQLRP